jgi:hypothetical protein
MKSIAYTLAALLIGATFAQANNTTETKSEGTASNLNAPAGETSAQNTTNQGEIKILEVEEEASAPAPTQASKE